LINWDESFSTGEAKLDAQHKTLFQFINQLHEDIVAEKPPSAFEYSLKFLADYAKSHFCYEESCMDSYRCPAAQSNKDAHKEFLVFYKFYEAKIKKEGFTPKRIAELHVFIEDWIVRHIRTVDTKLKPCISNSNKNTPISET
jgi:hemerythrin-like metal-binding protein